MHLEYKVRLALLAWPADTDWHHAAELYEGRSIAMWAAVLHPKGYTRRQTFMSMLTGSWVTEYALTRSALEIKRGLK